MIYRTEAIGNDTSSRMNRIRRGRKIRLYLYHTKLYSVPYNHNFTLVPHKL